MPDVIAAWQVQLWIKDLDRAISAIRDARQVRLCKSEDLIPAEVGLVAMRERLLKEAVQQVTLASA